MAFEGTEWRDEERHFEIRYRKFASKPFTVFHLSWRCYIIFERACSGIA
jgi:hypothetical protein